MKKYVAEYAIALREKFKILSKEIFTDKCNDKFDIW